MTTPDLLAIGKEHLGDVGDMAVDYWLSTGLLGLDLAINNGLPGGRVTELFGKKASGKTALALSVCHQAQKAGGDAFWIDLEGRSSQSLAQIYNKVNINENWFYYDSNKDGMPISIEDTFRLLYAVARAVKGRQVPTVFVIDSVAGFFSEDQDVSMTKAHQNMLVAKKMSTFFSYGLNQLIKHSNFYPIFINQTRASVSFFSYGPPEDATPGGATLEFYASTRIKMDSSTLTAKDDPDAKKDEAGRVIGRMLKAEIEKNSVGPPFRKFMFPFYLYEQAGGVIGFDDALSQINYLIARKALELGVTKEGKPKKGYYQINGVQNNKLGWRHRIATEPEVAAIFNERVRDQFVKDHR